MLFLKKKKKLNRNKVRIDLSLFFTTNQQQQIIKFYFYYEKRANILIVNEIKQ